MEQQDESRLRDRAKKALEPLGLKGPIRDQVWEAFKEHPDGIERIARQALEDQARKPQLRASSLFITDFKNGDHIHDTTPPPGKTGWRWVRGVTGAAGTYIEDPEGTDPLPPGYTFGSSGWGKPGEWRKDDDDTVERIDFHEHLRREREKKEPF